MKLLVATIIFTATLPNYLSAQNFKQLNFIKYQITRKDQTGKSSISGFVYLWFNDSLSYQQDWPMPGRLINEDGTLYTKKDSVKNAEFILALNKNYLETKRTTYLINTNNDDSTYIVDYDVMKDNPFYFKQRPYRNRFSEIVYVEDTIRMISGKICKLAIGIYNNPYDSSKTQQKIWYSIDIKSPSSPILWIRNMPGLIMAMESENLILNAINLEMPATTIGNFSFEVPASSYHTREKYNKVYKEYLLQFKNN